MLEEKTPARKPTLNDQVTRLSEIVTNLVRVAGALQHEELRTLLLQLVNCCGSIQMILDGDYYDYPGEEWYGEAGDA